MSGPAPAPAPPAAPPCTSWKQRTWLRSSATASCSRTLPTLARAGTCGAVAAAGRSAGSPALPGHARQAPACMMLRWPPATPVVPPAPPAARPSPPAPLRRRRLPQPQPQPQPQPPAQPPPPPPGAPAAARRPPARRPAAPRRPPARRWRRSGCWARPTRRCRCPRGRTRALGCGVGGRGRSQAAAGAQEQAGPQARAARLPARSSGACPLTRRHGLPAAPARRLARQLAPWRQPRAAQDLALQRRDLALRLRHLLGCGGGAAAAEQRVGASRRAGRVRPAAGAARGPALPRGRRPAQPRAGTCARSHLSCGSGRPWRAAAR